jgi:hypothetical protein
MECCYLIKSFGFIIILFLAYLVGNGGEGRILKGRPSGAGFVHGGEKVIVSEGWTRPRWLQDSRESQL